MSDLPGYDIRYTNPLDVKSLSNWLLDKDTNKWFPMSGDKEIEDTSKNWIGFYKFKASLTATLFGHPCAIGTIFLMPYRKVAHHAMFYLVVDPKHRHKGIGRSMVRNLLNLAKKNFRLESLHCEVFEGCPIITLLEQLQFQKVMQQEGFVKEEDNTYLSRIIYEHFFDAAQ